MPRVQKEIFSYKAEQDKFETAISELIENMLEKARASIIPPENVQSYSHGTQWQTVTSSSPDSVSGLEILQHGEAIQFGDLVNHNLEAIPQFVESLVSGFVDQFQKMLYQKVHETCEESGNIVDGKEAGSPTQSFLQALKQIQFGVDREGKISRPEFHLGSTAFENLKEDAERHGDNFRKEVEQITAQKEQEALDREAARLARFRTLEP